jgi:uncharacterized membrane protein YgaE (UPF0421/DUF939 family)
MWRAGLVRALMRSLVLIAAIIAILVFHRSLDLPAASWAVISAMLVVQTQAKIEVRFHGGGRSVAVDRAD